MRARPLALRSRPSLDAWIAAVSCTLPLACSLLVRPLMNRLQLRSARVLALLAAATFAAGCASADSSISAEETAKSEDPVELLDFWFSQVGLAQDGSTASKATGALTIEFLDAQGLQRTSVGGKPLRGTCGVTFVSPHYAITASHCVSDRNLPHPQAMGVMVHQWDITQASAGTLYGDSNIDGTFPNYTGTPASSTPGYVQSDYVCQVVSRCAWTDSDVNANATNYNCSQSSGSADVTMLLCPTRGRTAAWLPVATAASEVSNAQLEMYWFHEIVNAPTVQPAWNDPSLDLWTHYTHYTSQETNWHYVDSPLNALVPLKSLPFSNGTPRTRSGLTTNTNLFGCHGTSGSGILQHNAAGNLELLGPAHTGNWTTGNLCDTTSLSPTTPIGYGYSGLTFSGTSYVQALYAQYASSIASDRPRVIIFPNPPIGPIKGIAQ